MILKGRLNSVCSKIKNGYTEYYKYPYKRMVKSTVGQDTF